MGVVNVNEAVDRLIAIEVEAMAALSSPVTVEAVKQFLYAGEVYPYITHRMAATAIGADSEQEDTLTIDVIVRLVIGHATQGYHGQNDQQLYTYIPQIVDYINSRQRLQSASYPTALSRLRFARVVSVTGLTAFQNSGIAETQVGTEFTVRCTFINRIEQAYT